jgi:hypothetical protein
VRQERGGTIKEQTLYERFGVSLIDISLGHFLHCDCEAAYPDYQEDDQQHTGEQKQRNVLSAESIRGLGAGKDTS